MIKIKVNLGERSYPIYIGNDTTEKLNTFIKPDIPDAPIFVITNKTIMSLHAAKLKKALRPLSKNILFYEIPDSEKSKSFPVYIRTVRRLAGFARKKKPLVVAFGGGVIGDLAGFVASTYRRGVPLVQIPTTLLAQVDSSIGGKVGIDIKEAKNIVGNFCQPKIVISDQGFLRTLPEREIRNGLVEVIKYGIIKDRNLFSFLERNVGKILNLDSGSTEYIVSKSCRIKASVVEKDEFDTKGTRAILNFGHTLGHAVESASGYSKAVTHGAAVASGIVMASSIALRLGMIKKGERDRIYALLKKISPAIRMKPGKTQAVLKALSYDKKFVYGTNRFILPKRIGRVKIVDDIPLALVKAVIEEALIWK